MIGDSGATALADALRVNQSLTTLEYVAITTGMEVNLPNCHIEALCMCKNLMYMLSF